MFINFIYSFGFTALLQSLFDYDFANKWVGLAIFIGFYICSLLLQYIIYYVGTLKSYAIECEEILRNRHQMLKGCENVNVV